MRVGSYSRKRPGLWVGALYTAAGGDLPADGGQVIMFVTTPNRVILFFCARPENSRRHHQTPDDIRKMRIAMPGRLILK